MNKKEKGKVKWENIKRKGFMSYLIKIGIFYYGVIFFLTWTILVPFIDSNFTFNFIYRETFKNRLIVFGILSPIFGMLMSYTSWKGFERKYK